eukprot:scaffold94752_cov35-Attheya_sp.AAC.1
MATTPITAYTKLQHVPVGTAFKITSRVYTSYHKKGLEVVSCLESPSEYHPPTTLEPAILTVAPELYNIAKLLAMFAPLAPVFDTVGRLQDNMDGWQEHNPDAGVTVYNRKPTYYDELDAPRLHPLAFGHTGPGPAVLCLLSRGIFCLWSRGIFPG